jgi:hypothetical protein
MPDPSTPSSRRRERQPARTLPLATVVIITLSVAVAAILGTVVVLNRTTPAPTNVSAASSSTPPTSRTGSTPTASAATPSAEQVLGQVRDLRQRREVLVQQVQGPTMTVYYLKRFSSQGSLGVYEGFLDDRKLGPSRCVLIADPQRLRDAIAGTKSYTGKLVKLGERPYTMTTSVRGALGETTRDSTEFVETYEIAVDPEGDLRQLDERLDAAEHQLEQSFPNLPESQALPAERARRAEEARLHAARVAEVEQANADQKAADAERERQRIKNNVDRIAALDADIAKVDAAIAAKQQRIAEIQASDRPDDLKQKIIASIQAEITQAEQTRRQIEAKKGTVGHEPIRP